MQYVSAQTVFVLLKIVWKKKLEPTVIQANYYNLLHIWISVVKMQVKDKAVFLFL